MPGAPGMMPQVRYSGNYLITIICNNWSNKPIHNLLRTYKLVFNVSYCVKWLSCEILFFFESFYIWLNQRSGYTIYGSVIGQPTVNEGPRPLFPAAANADGKYHHYLKKTNSFNTFEKHFYVEIDRNVYFFKSISLKDAYCRSKYESIWLELEPTERLAWSLVEKV